MSKYMKENIEWASEKERTDALQQKGGKISGSYDPFTDKFRKILSPEKACSAVCDGKACKHCNADLPDDKTVVKGLDAQWITSNILACNRPNTRRVKEFNVIDQFKNLGVKSILNLQEVNEHAQCGDPLDADSGFSYSPTEFMQNEIFYYNYPIPDFSVPDSPAQLVDLLQVMQFAISQGKVMVHCHAGRGRTGLVIACYLIYNNLVSAQEAILYVRRCRSTAIQTQEQVDFVKSFEDFLLRIRTVYIVPPQSQATAAAKEGFTLEQFIGRQALLVKGESSVMRRIPKILYTLLQQILQTVGIKFSLRKLHSVLLMTYAEESDAAPKENLKSLLEKLVDPYKLDMQKQETSNAQLKASKAAEIEEEIVSIQRKINAEADYFLEQLAKETRLEILSGLVWSWLDQLSEPVLRYTDVDTVCRSNSKTATAKLRVLDKCQADTLLLFAAFFKALSLKANAAAAESDEKYLLDVLALRLLSHLTHCNFHFSLVAMIRSKFPNAASAASSEKQPDLQSGTKSTASSVFDDSVTTVELEQASLWTSNAVKLRLGHKRRLIYMFINIAQELKVAAPTDGDPQNKPEEQPVKQTAAVQPLAAEASVQPTTDENTTQSAEVAAQSAPPTDVAVKNEEPTVLQPADSTQSGETEEGTPKQDKPDVTLSASAQDEGAPVEASDKDTSTKVTAKDSSGDSPPADQEQATSN